MGILDDLKSNFKQGNTLIKLIYINIGIFVVVQLIIVLLKLYPGIDIEGWFNYWLAFPSNFVEFIHKPWTIITYMFMHADIWHILFNLLWLYWFGQIFLQYLDQRKMLGVYLLGGICGAVLYALVFNISPTFEYVKYGSNMVGASAAIMAVVISISVITPNYSVQLFLIGPVKLKYIALVTVVIDLISIQSSNAGGHIAHIGGAIFGYLYAVQYQKGKDISGKFIAFLERILSLLKWRKRMRVTYKRPLDDMEYNRNKIDQQKEIDRILDKIAKGGYGSLTREEKEFLFRSSQ
jgi:membrane associated rhomboid family serine protease